MTDALDMHAALDADDATLLKEVLEHIAHLQRWQYWLWRIELGLFILAGVLAPFGAAPAIAGLCALGAVVGFQNSLERHTLRLLSELGGTLVKQRWTLGRQP